MDGKARHFVLVHGACHGAWCWFKVATILQSMGHKTTALDLAACGVNPKQVQELHSMSDYFEPFMEFMGSLPSGEKVILVAHSLGGCAVSYAMERFPEKIVVAVFAPAWMPGPDLSLGALDEEFTRTMGSFMDSKMAYDDGPCNPPTSVLFGLDFLSTKVYQLSPPEDLTLAMLSMRPLRLYGGHLYSDDLPRLTKLKYGTVPRVFITVDHDNVMVEESTRKMIESNPPDEIMEVSGSDHMILYTKPKEFCSCLQEIAKKYA
uniref:(S)-hydroxynitrile lyase n=1 Tax=Rhizophora mucronata TaxID=61149 RepID=A0A2P2P5C8_RHIMU